MNVRVLLFGPYADAAGTRDLVLSFPERDGVTAAEVLAALGTAAPPVKKLLSAANLAVNNEFAQPGQRIVESDECAVVGLVGGG